MTPRTRGAPARPPLRPALRHGGDNGHRAKARPRSSSRTPARRTARAIGGRMAGSFGTGCFSFYATKNMTTGEGGMITTNDPATRREGAPLPQPRRDVALRHGEPRLQLPHDARSSPPSASCSSRSWPSGTSSDAPTPRYLSERLRGVDHAARDAGPAPRLSPVHRPRALGGRRRLRGARRAGGAAGASRASRPASTTRCPSTASRCTSSLGYHDDLPVAERLSREVLSLPVHPALSRTTWRRSSAPSTRRPSRREAPRDGGTRRARCGRRHRPRLDGHEPRPRLREMEGVELAAVADVVARAAGDAGAAAARASMTTTRRMLAEERLDLVSVCVPTLPPPGGRPRGHRKGVALLVEKPIAATLDEGREMARAAREAGRPADGRPRGALQPRGARGEAPACRRASSGASSRCTRDAPGPSRSASATSASSMTWRRTISTSCASCSNRAVERVYAETVQRHQHRARGHALRASCAFATAPSASSTSTG